MGQMTLADSPDFVDELRKRSEIADAVGLMYGTVGLRQIVAEVLLLKGEHEERTDTGSEEAGAGSGLR